MNSSASTIVNDLYRPFTGRSDERHLLRVARVMTVVWGCVLTAVAFGARRLEDNVVNNALAIASFVSGILLGLFLLGILDPSRGAVGGACGCARRGLAVRFAKFGTIWPGRGLPWSARSPCSPSGCASKCVIVDHGIAGCTAHPRRITSRSARMEPGSDNHDA